MINWSFPHDWTIRAGLFFLIYSRFNDFYLYLNFWTDFNNNCKEPHLNPFNNKSFSAELSDFSSEISSVSTEKGKGGSVKGSWSK